MAESLGTIYYDVDANLEPLLGKIRQAESALGGLGKEMGKTDQGAAQMQKSFDRTERSAASLGGQLNGLTRVIRGVVAAMALREAAQWVQGYQTMAERVRMATESLDEFEMVQRRLMETADGTYRSLAEAQEVYIQTSIGLRDMGYNTAQALDIVDSLSYAFVRNQTSADKAASALNALTRATNRGTVLTDHWASLLIAVPTILDDIAAASGMTTKEISRMGYEGKLSADLLTQGLLMSRDANKAAADSMATDLVDASVRVRNAITVTLVAMEEQTGALQSVTDGIITAAEALLAFGQDAEKMEAFLNLATTAAASLAAVIAGRLLTSLGGAAAALYQNTIAARAKAAAELDGAKTAAALAAENLIQAQTAERAARGLSTHAAAAASLKVAEDAATAATNRLTAAQTAMAGSFRVSTAAANGLRAAMAFLGGPTGVILIAAAALWTWHKRAQDARNATLELSSSVQGLTAEMRELEKIENEKRIEKETRSLERQNKALERNARLRPHASRGEAAARAFEEEMLRRRVAIQKTEERIEALQKRQQQLANANIPAPRRTGGTTEPTLTGGTPQELTEFQKLEQSLKNQIELAKLTGLARAELAALQRLGADATEEERQRIKELVGEIYRLEEAQKAAEKSEQERLRSSEEARRAAEDNASVIAGLREQIYQTTLAGGDLAARQAELTLNDYATPEQVEQVRALARELYAAQQEAAQLEQRRSAFAGDAAGAIRGQVSPLSGGAFDDQAARYEAEAAAERERYAAQLERLREAKELEIEVIGGYQALEQQMAQEHADRLMQIEEARVQAMAAQSAAAFGQMASDIEAFAKTFGAENSKMMAIAKASAIAQTIMETYAGAQKAFSALAGIPIVGPALGTAAAAAAIAGGMARVAQIRGTAGRLAGGPVSAGRMYRVNENGAPEVFSAANGQQFMIPNQRGEVISNRNATTGGGGVVINIHNAPQGTVAESSQDQDGQQIIDIWVADFMADGRTASAVQGKFGLSPQGR